MVAAEVALEGRVSDASTGARSASRGTDMLLWLGGLVVGVESLVTTFAVIPTVAWMSRKMGKKNAFMLSQGISIIGYVLLWFLMVPGKPWMFMFALPFFSFGIGGLFTLMMSMTADVCDLDELATGKRREGIFGAIYWWRVKFGFAIAGLLSGAIMSWVGFTPGQHAWPDLRALYRQPSALVHAKVQSGLDARRSIVDRTPVGDDQAGEAPLGQQRPLGLVPGFLRDVLVGCRMLPSTPAHCKIIGDLPEQFLTRGRGCGGHFGGRFGHVRNSVRPPGISSSSSLSRSRARPYRFAAARS